MKERKKKKGSRREGRKRKQGREGGRKGGKGKERKKDIIKKECQRRWSVVSNNGLSYSLYSWLYLERPTSRHWPQGQSQGCGGERKCGTNLILSHSPGWDIPEIHLVCLTHTSSSQYLDWVYKELSIECALSTLRPNSRLCLQALTGQLWTHLSPGDSSSSAPSSLGPSLILSSENEAAATTRQLLTGQPCEWGQQVPLSTLELILSSVPSGLESGNISKQSRGRAVSTTPNTLWNLFSILLMDSCWNY